ncbi:MAG: carbon monoxide dehydrogenase subunit G [Alphaproteobacteria bacterium]|nr:carbon monoxide dehydrogenase subunit G [Alphaproteobacteria bacterium]
MLVEGQFEIDVPREKLFAELINPAVLAACVPGCESVEMISPTSYRAVIAVGLGVITARFNLTVEVTQQSPPETVLSVTRGEEGGQASMITATNEVHLDDLGGGLTRLRYRSDVSVTGRFGKFALGVMRKKAESMGQDFAKNLRERLSRAATSGQAVEQSVVKPVVPAGWWRALLDFLTRWLRPAT